MVSLYHVGLGYCSAARVSRMPFAKQVRCPGCNYCGVTSNAFSHWHSHLLYLHLGPLSSDLHQFNITGDTLSSAIFPEDGPDFNSFPLPSQIFGVASFQYDANASGLDWPRTEQPLPGCLISLPRATDETEEKGEESSQNSGKQRPPRKAVDSQRCPEKGCGYRAKTRRDVDRHNQSVHKKTMSFYCQWPGCPRGLKGWYRKDLRDRHVLLTHKSGKRRSQSTPKPDSCSIFANEHKENLSPSEYEEDSCEDSEEFSVSELLKMLRKERDRCVQLEGELEALRSKYDKREDKWLNIIAKGTWGDGASQAVG
ncbi:hypothetical protein GGR51DRAFT_524761 [Nemania sp. FL0031]|nr:hypothetical protein GGR51DRAFT_524761 [Nemania sp. FL0031]